MYNVNNETKFITVKKIILKIEIKKLIRNFCSKMSLFNHQLEWELLKNMKLENSLFGIQNILVKKNDSREKI